MNDRKKKTESNSLFSDFILAAVLQTFEFFHLKLLEMAELRSAANDLAELADASGSAQRLVAGALGEIRKAIRILEERRKRGGVFKRVIKRKYGFKPHGMTCHALWVTEKGMTLAHPGGKSFVPFRVCLDDALDQPAIYPSVFCKFPLGDDSKLTVNLDLRGEALVEDLPGLFTVKFFNRGKPTALPKVFYLP